MNLIVRIISIREHKNVSFLEIFNSELGHKQILIDNSKFNVKEFKLGDIINAECNIIKNNKGINVFELNKINWCNHPQEWTSNKNINKNMQDNILKNQIEALNGGKQINLFELRQELEQKISTILDLDNFQKVKCKIMEEERTSAGFKPIKCKTFDNLDLYLRVTMENQLKQICSIILKSIYSIDTVFYDVSPSANFQKEINTLELVTIHKDINYLIEFIKKINQLMILLKEKYELNSIQLPPTLDICDYKETDGNVNFVNSKFKNNIVLNVPVESPFIKYNPEIGRTETRWYVNGQMVGHGYEDEINYEKIKEVLDKQKNELNIKIANEMEYIKWGMPNTISYGMGIDLLIKKYYDIDKFINVTNSMGINYTKKLR